MSLGRYGCGTIVIAEDEKGLRSLLTDLFDAQGFTVVAASTGEDALAAARSERPGVAVLDVELGGISGYEVCRALRDEFGDGLPIILISGRRTEPLDRIAGLLIGADDYLVKPFAPGELLARVQALLRSSAAQRSEIRRGLSGRELEILRLMAEGLKPCEIAERLVISPKTVGSHTEHIFAKLGVHSRAEAVGLAYREELLRAG
ncbi:MAG TPA: response regulator transcription factor [Gaiellaceae bacterium]|nr:response regulator transcription factor [Gaiellaceae bacterium]